MYVVTTVLVSIFITTNCDVRVRHEHMLALYLLVSYRSTSTVYMNKLSLVGMQLPEKYKENFDVSSEGPSSGVTKGLRSKRRNSPYIFQVVASLPTKACSYYWHYLHWHKQFKA